MPTERKPLEDERSNEAPGRGTSGSPISKTGPAQPGPVDRPEEPARKEEGKAP